MRSRILLGVILYPCQKFGCGIVQRHHNGSSSIIEAGGENPLFSSFSRGNAKHREMRANISDNNVQPCQKLLVDS